jgi:hypothetical protein
MKQNNSCPDFNEYTKTPPRPKSFSEGHGVVNHFPKYLEYQELPEPVPEPIIVKKEETDYVGIIYNKIIGFTFHLVLIATFELLFFNYYIVQYENNAVISLSNQLVAPLMNTCSQFTNVSKIVVDDFINLFVNETVININADSDKSIREINNKYIAKLSLVYYSWIISGFLGILLINLYLKRKIDFMMIVIDNVIMISILGIYEYLFFHNIIFKYLTLGPNELIKNVMGNLLNDC